MRAAFAILILTLWTPLSLAAAPGADRIAISSFHVTGQGASPPAVERLRASLRAGLAGAGYAVVPEAEVDAQRASAGLAKCEAGPCLQQLGERLGLSGIVRAQVQRIGSSDYTLTLEFYRPEAPEPLRPIARVSESCEVCTESDADAALARAATELAARARGVSGDLEATAPASQPRAPLEALPAAPTMASRRPLRIAAIVTGALGVAALTVGFVELGLEHACPVPGTSCPGGRDTSAGQTAGFVIGGVGIATGAVLAVFGFSRHGAELAVAPAIGRHGAAVRLALRFQ